MQADPIRPYVYLHNGGTDLTIYNVYTGAVIRTLANVGTQLGDMTIAHDGSTLYVVDNSIRTVVPIDLDTDTVNTGWSFNSVNYSYICCVAPYITYTRTNGFAAIITGYGAIFDAARGIQTHATYILNPPFTFYPDPGFPFNAIVAVSLNGNRFCVVNYGLSPYTLGCYPLDYTSIDGGQLLVGPDIYGAWGIGSDGRDIALNADGTRVYVAGVTHVPASPPYYPLAVVAYDPNATTAYMQPVQYLATSSDAFPVALQVRPDGKIHIGTATTGNDPKDVWIYNPNGTLVTDYRVSGYAKRIFERMLAVSGDGLRMITQSDDPKLQFTTVGP
jgi:hypothetical protein